LNAEATKVIGSLALQAPPTKLHEPLAL